MAATLLAALVAGGLIGPLVHAALSGHAGLPVRATAALGAVGALVGTWIYMAASGSHAPGVDWASLLIGAIVAAALIAGHHMVSRGHGNEWVTTRGNEHGSQRPSGYER